jgi:hypothetical protein
MAISQSCLVTDWDACLSLGATALTIRAVSGQAPSSQAAPSQPAPGAQQSLTGGLQARYFPYEPLLCPETLLHIRLILSLRIKNAKGEDTVLGTGSYGKVMLMRDAKSNDRLVAVKLLIRSNDAEASNAMEEAFKVKALQHPNIVELLHAFIVSQPQLQVCSVLEYCKDGDLEAFLSKAKTNPSLAPFKVHPCFNSLNNLSKQS